MQNLLLILAALFAGILLPTQAGINAQLAKVLGHPLQATVVSFVIGTLGAIGMCWLMGIPMPAFQQAASAPPWLWVGGLLGVTMVGASIFLAPKLGAATMVGLIITGQLFASITIDHFGLLGFPTHQISPFRVVGVILLIIGVILIRKF